MDDIARSNDRKGIAVAQRTRSRDCDVPGLARVETSCGFDINCAACECGIDVGPAQDGARCNSRLKGRGTRDIDRRRTRDDGQIGRVKQ